MKVTWTLYSTIANPKTQKFTYIIKLLFLTNCTTEFKLRDIINIKLPDNYSYMYITRYITRYINLASPKIIYQILNIQTCTICCPLVSLTTSSVRAEQTAKMKKKPNKQTKNKLVIIEQWHFMYM